jgi:parallel beta-helix repeat protein
MHIILQGVENMKSKKLVVIICMLVIASVFSIVTTSVASDGSTIYVDDDNTQGPWDGTQEHPYQYIQDGIDAADDGDTIFVYSGTYYENLQIDKSVTLTSEDKHNTVIDGNSIGNVVNVTADSVAINGFTVRNGEAWEAGIYVYDSSETSISDCIVTLNNGIGIELDRTFRVWVSNCTISSNNQFGVCIYTSNGIRLNSRLNVVTNCVISDNDEGVFLDDTTSDFIIKNQITDNHVYGIHLAFAEDIGVYDNNLYDNNENAYFQGILRNYWSRNYWGNSIKIGVEIILGRVICFPWLNFDWNPATEPYDIGGE